MDIIPPFSKGLKGTQKAVCRHAAEKQALLLSGHGEQDSCFYIRTRQRSTVQADGRHGNRFLPSAIYKEIK